METFVLACWMLLAAWSALVRFEGERTKTLVARFAVNAAVPSAVFLLLPGANISSFAIVGVLFAMFLAIPILVGTYLFDWLHRFVGTQIYVGGLIVSSILLAVSGNSFVRGTSV